MGEQAPPHKDTVEVKQPYDEKISRRNLVRGGLASAALLAGIAWDFTRNKSGNRSSRRFDNRGATPLSSPDVKTATPAPIEEEE